MFNSRSARIAIAATLLTAVSSMAAAKTCDVTVEGDDRMKFDKAEIAVAADCTEVNLTLKHTGKLPATAMGHNWVLTAEGRCPRAGAYQAHRRRREHEHQVFHGRSQEGRRLHLLLFLPWSLGGHEGQVQVRMIRSG